MSVRTILGTENQVTAITEFGVTELSIPTAPIMPGPTSVTSNTAAVNLSITSEIITPSAAVSIFENPWTVNPASDYSILTSTTAGVLSWFDPTENITFSPTFNAQKNIVSTGYNQGGFGSGSAGTQYKISTNTCDYFDTTQGGLFPQSVSFYGSVFDGRYIYLIPTSSITDVVRYDTTLPITSPSSYAYQNLILLLPDVGGFNGGCFDGRYVYFVPNDIQGDFTRFDPQLGFTNPAAYSVFLLPQGGTYAPSTRFSGAIFDGRYIYLTPSGGGSNTFIIRYDPTLEFTSSGSYEYFNAETVNAYANSFNGGCFDGRYVYFPINDFLKTAYLKYDTTLSFSNVASYSYVTVSVYSASNANFSGAVFDGRSVYFIPYPATVHETFVKYDTVADETTLYELTGLGSSGGCFDGRYIYLMSNAGATNQGQIVQYDTTLPFTSSGSYVSFDATTVNADCIGFIGAVFDGNRVYYIPSTYGTLLAHGAYHGPQKHNGIV